MFTYHSSFTEAALVVAIQPGKLMSKCKWQSYSNKNYRCKVPAEEGSEFCIFHEPGEKDIERFKEKFYEQIDQAGPEDQRNPKYEFVGYSIPLAIRARAEGASREVNELVLPLRIEEGLLWPEARIKGNICLERAAIGGSLIFHDAVVHGTLWLDHVTIHGDASLNGAIVKGGCYYDGASIKGNVFFLGVIVGGDLSFLKNALIEGDAVFKHAQIEGNALLRGATIGGNLSFAEAKIRGGALLVGVTIKGNAWFDYAKVGGDASFVRAAIEETADFSGALFARALDFSNGSFGSWMAFSLCRAKRLWLGSHRPTTNPLVSDRSGVKLAHADSADAFWRFACRTFEEEGRKKEADAAHYFERIWHCRSLRTNPLRESLYERETDRRWTRRLGRSVMKIVYSGFWLLDCFLLRWTTAYGASLPRLFATWAVLIGSFTSVYYLLAFSGAQLFNPTSPGLRFPLSFGRALYFSIITFTTLGYGDIQPMPGLGSALTATEAILGGIMMALTVLVVGRKFMR